MINTKSAFIAIVGKPNVGKSSLLNKLLGEKIAIVSNKPQTTRTRITGVLTQNETQFVFIDTPGIHKPKTKLSQHMIKGINQSVSDVDAAIMVVEPFGKPLETELELIESFKKLNMPAILVINKIDLIENKEDLLERISLFSSLYNFDAIIPISILQDDGCDLVLKEIYNYAVESVHFFPDDTLTDQPERVIVSEIIREKILSCMQQEIPHGTAVGIESMKERKGGRLMDIDATIYCERDSHKGMIIGKQGSMLKKIASMARQDIEAFLDIKVNLQCFVKVKEDWRNKEGLIKNFGLSSQNN